MNGYHSEASGGANCLRVFKFISNDGIFVMSATHVNRTFHFMLVSEYYGNQASPVIVGLNVVLKHAVGSLKSKQTPG